MFLTFWRMVDQWILKINTSIKRKMFRMDLFTKNVWPSSFVFNATQNTKKKIRWHDKVTKAAKARKINVLNRLRWLNKIKSYLHPSALCIDYCHDCQIGIALVIYVVWCIDVRVLIWSLHCTSHYVHTILHSTAHSN